MTTTPHRRSPLLLSLLAGVVFSANPFTSDVQASLLLEFAGGGSSAVPVTNQVDAFTGATGQGWASAWALREQSADNTNISAAVVNATPFSPGSGNYLAVQYQSVIGTSRAGVVRQFSTNPGNGGVDATQPFSLSFDFRVDAFSGALNQSTDQFLFSTGTTDAVGSFATASPIRLWYVAGTGWQVNNGTTYVVIPGLATGITAGLVYEFDITIDPTLGKWGLSVGYNGGTYSLSNLDLYPDTSVANANFLSWRSVRAAGASWDWALDNVQVVPEPGSVVLAALGATVMLGWFRKRSPR